MDAVEKRSYGNMKTFVERKTLERVGAPGLTRRRTSTAQSGPTGTRRPSGCRRRRRRSSSPGASARTPSSPRRPTSRPRCSVCIECLCRTKRLRNLHRSSPRDCGARPPKQTSTASAAAENRAPQRRFEVSPAAPALREAPVSFRQIPPAKMFCSLTNCHGGVQF